MIPFDTFNLAAVAAELRATVLGAKVQKIQQPSPSDLVLALFGPTGARHLLLCADPKGFRVHLTQIRRENPITPPAFCAVCRKYLEGARLDAVTMPRFDRLLNLVFRAHDGERLILAAELMGRNANLVLVSGAGVVRGAVRPAPAEERPLRPGSPYADPPGYGDKREPGDAASVLMPGEADARAWLLGTFSGIGGFAADEILARAGSAGSVPAALASLMAAVSEDRFAPHSLGGEDGATEGVWAFEPLTVPPDRRFRRESISVALDTFYATLAAAGSEASEHAALQKAITRERAFREKERASARKTIAEAARAEPYEQAGNNLLAGLARAARGMTSVTVPDLYGADGAETTIALDPKRSPQENAQSYFDRARKTRDAAEYAKGRLADLEEEADALAALARDMERAAGDEAYARIRRRLTEIVGEKRAGSTEKPPARARARPFDGHRIRTAAVEGYTLLIGETAEANDYLTTRVAAPSDLWMHVRSAPGAHGVLRTNGRPQAVPPAVVRRAAEIVAARSGSAVKHASVVAVDVMEKRYVRKPRGAKPGLVTYTSPLRGRTLDVVPGL